jgi:hypothetical protein
VNRIAIAVCALLSAGACVAQEPRVATAAQAAKTADTITYDAFRIAASKMEPRAQRRALGEAAQRFASALDAAARNATPQEANAAAAAEGESIEAKLLAIATDRQRHPERYREIRDIYMKDQPREWVSQSAPPPALEHSTEAYRLAWEMYLLTPQPADASPGYLESAAEAVGLIANPASVVTLRHLIDISTQPNVEVTPAAAARQRLALRTLIRIPTPRAADVLLDAVAAIGRQQERASVASRWNPRAYAVDLLAVLPPQRMREWRALVGRAAGKHPNAAPLLRSLEQKTKVPQ